MRKEEPKEEMDKKKKFKMKRGKKRPQTSDWSL